MNEQDEDAILYFQCKNLLPEGHVLVLHLALGTLLQLSTGSDHPVLIAEERFTTAEKSIVHPLLSSVPMYCPYEVLSAHFLFGRYVTPAKIEQCRGRLRAALECNVWDEEIRPLRNVLSRTRLKLRQFGIEITSVLSSGYMLLPISASALKRAGNVALMKGR